MNVKCPNNTRVTQQMLGHVRWRILANEHEHLILHWPATALGIKHFIIICNCNKLKASNFKSLK